MVNALINALALAPAAATTGPSQQISNLQTIINQVEHFYGEGWHTILWGVGLIVGALGVLAPLYINYDARKLMEQQIANARRDAKIQTENAIRDITAKIEEAERKAEARTTRAQQRTKDQLRHFSNATGWVMKATRQQEEYANRRTRYHFIEMLDASIRAAIEFARMGT